MTCDDEALELVGELIAPEFALAMAEGKRRDPVFAGLARQLIASHTIEATNLIPIRLGGRPEKQPFLSHRRAMAGGAAP